MLLRVQIIAPDRTVWDAQVEEIILPSSTGQLAILTNHAPLLTAIDIGVMRVKVKKEWTPIVLFGGFAEVENNNVVILVNGAEEVSEINVIQSEKLLENAILSLQQATNNKDKIAATQNIRKARSRVQAVTMEKE